ncbi:MAG: flagellar basal body rod protein FlgB [Planctomycetota bacterium]
MGLLNCDGLLRLLDAAQFNHDVVANNLANLNTPGYRTQRVRFARELEDLLDETGHLRPGKEIETELWRPMFRDVGADGNDVKLEREIVQLNKNGIRMRLYLAAVKSRVQRLRAAIEGR